MNNLASTPLVIITLIVMITIPIVLLGTYYYTDNLVRNMNNNPKCNNCLSTEYKCNTVLKYAPIPLALILVLNMLVKAKVISINSFVLGLIAVVNFGLYIWFMYCLYNNLKDIYSRKCPCAEEHRQIIDKLQIVSKVLYFIMLFGLGILGLLIVLLILSIPYGMIKK